MSDQQLVLAIFADEAAADQAVVSLENWDAAIEPHRLAAIGVLVVDEAGKIKEHKLGARSVGKGAAIGLAPGRRRTADPAGRHARWRHPRSLPPQGPGPHGRGPGAHRRRAPGGQGGRGRSGHLGRCGCRLGWLTELGGAVEVHEASARRHSKPSRQPRRRSRRTAARPCRAYRVRPGRRAHAQSGVRPQRRPY